MTIPEPPHFDGQRWSNADADRIELVAADPHWPQRFREEADAIRAAVAMPQLGIEHFGSTAVPGLEAKPIIDILLLPPPDADWEQLVAPLESLGYQYWRDNPAPQRMFFVKGMPPQGNGRTHHIHVMNLADADRHLIFRNWLRTHPRDAAAYQRSKRELAARYADDRDAYTAGKDAIVGKILGKALGTRRDGARVQGGEPGGPVQG
ncbi:GrpB family protein [Pseudomonas sp. UL073]|uniref:GrpB family protein n=1 Tax=Zestomonas insulae TaxID=2809017 RepID=A0ABS2IE63_9GAMM|nr:GrpB family protein [Pseudomonas insulae]MBM7061362.1 GrpB family protein [Pseudomonas insulae]